MCARMHTHAHLTALFPGLPEWAATRKVNLDFTEARDSEWQWHQLGHMQVCTSLQTDNHASTPPLSFLQARCPSCRPTNSVKALNADLCPTHCRKNRIDIFCSFAASHCHLFLSIWYVFEIQWLICRNLPILTYPTCIWCPRWRWPKSNFADFWRQKLESLGTVMTLLAWSSI